ncbi:MAG: nitrile hydratase subunit beta [Vicinamibacteria bacterium]
MNGVHDMGGMHGMGPIQHEKNEPVFHSRWEGRVFALTMAVEAFGKSTLDASRHRIERIEGMRYLRMSYYEKWLTGLLALLVGTDQVSPAEIRSGKRTRGSSKSVPALGARQVQAFVAQGAPASRGTAVEPRFHVSQRVRARNINPIAHTRLPRYARGKTGIIERDHGVFVFPDTNARLVGEKPQHVYSVRFSARELWGEEAKPQDSVHLDLWDDYLEPA